MNESFNLEGGSTMGKTNWSEIEKVKVVGSIVVSRLIIDTEKRTVARKQIIESLVKKFYADPDFSARLKADDPEDTIRQHIRGWIRHLEDGRDQP